MRLLLKVEAQQAVDITFLNQVENEQKEVAQIMIYNEEKAASSRCL